jgi:hypothetical protein
MYMGQFFLKILNECSIEGVWGNLPKFSTAFQHVRSFDLGFNLLYSDVFVAIVDPSTFFT